MPKLDEFGREVLDSTPMQPPIGYHRTPSLAEQIRSMVRSEKLALEAEAAGAETFEEADDFDVGDDFDPTSPYEQEFDPVPIGELKRRQEEENASPPPPSQKQKEKESGDQPDPVIGSGSDDPKPAA